MVDKSAPTNSLTDETIKMSTKHDSNVNTKNAKCQFPEPFKVDHHDSLWAVCGSYPKTIALKKVSKDGPENVLDHQMSEVKRIFISR